MEYEPTDMDMSLMGEGHISMCTATDCLYNESNKCMADGVIVNFHQTHADCSTYTHNQHIPGAMVEDVEAG